MEYKKGRGAQQNINNKFHQHQYERDYTDEDIDEINDQPKSNYTVVHPKTIVNKVTSPDVGLLYSLNPYQGCEHGCIYCYARNSHEYWGYGAGLDFEQQILVKRNAPELLREFLKKPTWQAQTIMLSGNTDCYQPIERKEQITRKLLQTFYEFRHPVGIITKNVLLRRDFDVIEQLAKHNLIHVTVSITSLKEELRRKLEPRTATAKQKLKIIEECASRNIPVQLMMGPIIPGLNNYEIFDVSKAAANAGAYNMVFTVVHLNGHIGELFTDWVKKAFPLKAERTLSLIKQVHNGNLNDSRWGIRKRGEGEIARMIHRQVALAKEKYFRGKSVPKLNVSLHQHYKTDQLNLFFERDS